MQGVAAKNDASYDLSSARASVTGQTTVAASAATTSLPNGRIVTALFAGALFSVRSCFSCSSRWWPRLIPFVQLCGCIGSPRLSHSAPLACSTLAITLLEALL